MEHKYIRTISIYECFEEELAVFFWITALFFYNNICLRILRSILAESIDERLISFTGTFSDPDLDRSCFGGWSTALMRYIVYSYDDTEDDYTKDDEKCDFFWGHDAVL
jgi:hypothetical protein